MAFIITLWMAGLLSAYYLFHKPMDTSLAAAFIRFLWTVIPVLWVISLAGGLGRKIIHLEKMAPIERAFLQAAFGAGIFSVVILIFGLTIGYLRWVLWALTVLPLPFLFRSMRDWWRDWVSVKQLWTAADAYTRWVILLVGILCLQALLTALALPVHYDALTYHLALPKTYLDTGLAQAGRDWVRGGMPQTGEILYAWVMNFGKDSSAAVLGWLTGVMAVVTLVSFIQNHLNLKSAWVGAATLLCGSSVAAALGWGYIDWFCLFFGLAALICLLEWLAKKRHSWILLVGLFCGLAFASKYTGGVILAGCGLAVLAERSGEKKLDFRSLLVLAGGFLIVAVPWLLKNLILTGNPLAPYLAGSVAMPAARQQVIQGSVPFGNWLDIVFLPFRATIIGAEGAEGYSHTIGVLFLLLGGLAWIKPVSDEKTRRWYKVTAILALTTIVIWIIGNRFSGMLVQNRMYYAAFPAFACLAALGFDQLNRLEISQVRMGRLAGVIVLLVLGLNVIELGRDVIRSQAIPYLTNVISGADYREQNLGWYARAIQSVADSQEKTILIYEPRGLDCLPNCQPDEILDRWSYDYHRLGSCEAVVSDWKTLGFTRALVYQSGIDFFLTEDDPNHQEPDLQALQACLGTLQVDHDFGGIYQIYGLK